MNRVVMETPVNTAAVGYQVSAAQVREAFDWFTALFMQDLQTSREPEIRNLVSVAGSEEQVASRIRLGVAQFLSGMERCAPSSGYEPLLIKRGENPVIARVKAYMTVRQGRRIALESRRRRDVVGAIRFLGTPNRSRWAIARKIRLLFVAAQETWIIRTLFVEAGWSDSVFISMLPSAVQGNHLAIECLLKIASNVAPRMRLPRGPKVSAASAAHELLLEKHGTRRASAYSYSELERDYVDEATRATRLEFPGAFITPRPASRRLKARRQLRECRP
jgi:hypothetical protein